LEDEAPFQAPKWTISGYNGTLKAEVQKACMQRSSNTLPMRQQPTSNTATTSARTNTAITSTRTDTAITSARTDTAITRTRTDTAITSARTDTAITRTRTDTASPGTGGTNILRSRIPIARRNKSCSVDAYSNVTEPADD
jgi:hypothetical protein